MIRKINMFLSKCVVIIFCILMFVMPFLGWLFSCYIILQLIVENEKEFNKKYKLIELVFPTFFLLIVHIIFIKLLFN